MELEEKKVSTGSEEDDDAASVDVMSTQESVDAKGEDEDEDEEEMEMTEEEDDEDTEMTEEELLDDDNRVAGKDSAPAVKHAKKRVRISDISTIHGDEDEEDADEEDEERESAAEEDEEDEEDEDEFEEDDDVDEEDEKEKQQQQAAAAALNKIELSDSASMLRMIQSLPDQEARRHEQFRRAHFERGAIKRCMTKVIQEFSAADKKVPSVNNVMAIVMAGMTKVFVGEITAEARRIMERNGETGPIRPRHLREAHRKYYKRRPLARGRNLRRLFR